VGREIGANVCYYYLQANRSSEATLAKDFSQIQIKKLELEFSVDPLFKKASADFDEGGAKGLLLNHLSIDSNGRIVFDSSDDKDERKDRDDEEDGEEALLPPEEEPELQDEPAEIINKLAFLKNRFLPDLARLDTQDVCPSLKGWDLNSSEGMTEIPFIKALEDREDEDPVAKDPGHESFHERPDMAFGFDDGFGLGADSGDEIGMAFGEGGEAWANEAIADAADRLLSPSKRPLLGFGADKEGDSQESRFNSFGGNDDILSYFDEALQKNWAGPEHWRIRRIKDNAKPANAPVRQRREREAFEINFMDPAADVPEEMMKAPKLPHTIMLPKKDRVSKTRNLLPDDKHFNSRQLIRLFLKPKASMLRRKKNAGPPGGDVAPPADEPPENLDEDFWAKENMAEEIQASSTPGPKGNYDANFFNDDNLDLPASLGDDDDDDNFADARETFSPGVEGAENPAIPGGTMPLSSQFPQTQAIDFGANLLTQNRRVRPEYVQYARVAKKVDVRKLKENIWSGLKFEEPASEDGLEPVCIYPPSSSFHGHQLTSYTDSQSYSSRQLGRAKEVYTSDQRPVRSVPAEDDVGHQHELLLHLSAPSGERKGACGGGAGGCQSARADHSERSECSRGGCILMFCFFFCSGARACGGRRWVSFFLFRPVFCFFLMHTICCEGLFGIVTLYFINRPD
jgi:condensin complex subunit 2